MKSFHLNKRIICVLTCIPLLFLIGCAGQANREAWETDINKRMPAISMPNSPSAFPESRQMPEMPPRESSMNLSIEQAVMAVLQHNRDLNIQKLEPVKAGTFEMIERASFDPEMFAEISYSRKDVPDASQTEGDQIITEKKETALLGLRKTFVTGTLIETEISHERDRSSDTPEERRTRLGITLTQSLLNGLGPSVHIASVKQANLDMAISIQELSGFIETLIADTENAYWQTVLSKQKITIFAQSLAIAKKQRDEIEQQIAVGILPRTEAAAARSEVALREQDLIDARSLNQEHRLKLIHLISPGYDNQFDLPVNLTSKPEIETLPVTNLTDRIKLAEKARFDLNEARLRLERNRLETIITRNGILPRLDFFIALGRTGQADTFKATFKNLDRYDTTDFKMGLTFNHALGNRESEGKNRASLVSRLQAKKAVENLQTIIELDVRLAVNEIERARKQITATRTTRTFQEETYAAEKDRFDVGSSTALLVSQAQRDLLAARIAEVEAIVNFRLALVNLYLAEGSLLDMRGIRIDSEGSN